MKKRILTIEKFRILEFKRLARIKGGTGVTTEGGSENTTYTTDPAIPCPDDNTNPSHTTNNPNGNTGIPTMGQDPEGFGGP